MAILTALHRATSVGRASSAGNRPCLVVLGSGVMLKQIPRLIGSTAIGATLLMSGMCAVAPVNAAQADDCLAAPNSTAPQGSRWYCRLDSATQRKCSYVRALGQPVQQAAPPTIGRATPHSMPVPSEPKPAADGVPKAVSPGGTTRPSAHVETSAVKPTAAPISSAITDDTTSSIPEVPAPQASTFSEISAQTTARHQTLRLWRGQIQFPGLRHWDPLRSQPTHRQPQRPTT